MLSLHCQPITSKELGVDSPWALFFYKRNMRESGVIIVRDNVSHNVFDVRKKQASLPFLLTESCLVELTPWSAWSVQLGNVNPDLIQTGVWPRWIRVLPATHLAAHSAERGPRVGGRQERLLREGGSALVFSA